MDRVIIQTEYSAKPIPDRQFDWVARLSYFNGDDDQPIGYGKTEIDAVVDLIHEAFDFDGDGCAQDEIINLAILGWQAASAEASQ